MVPAPLLAYLHVNSRQADRPTDARCAQGRHPFAYLDANSCQAARLTDARCGQGRRRLVFLDAHPCQATGSTSGAMRDQAVASARAAMCLNAQSPEAQVPTVAPSPSDATDKALPNLAAAQTLQAETEGHLERAPFALRTRVPGRR